MTAAFDALLDELERWNRRVNLTAVRRREQMQVLHIADSLAARPLLHGRRVLDVGTGPGFPGLPLAIAEPGREFTLLDSNSKKIRFVEHAAAVLGLDNPGAGIVAEARGDRRTPRWRGRGVCGAERALSGGRIRRTIGSVEP